LRQFQGVLHVWSLTFWFQHNTTIIHDMNYMGPGMDSFHGIDISLVNKNSRCFSKNQITLQKSFLSINLSVNHSINQSDWLIDCMIDWLIYLCIYLFTYVCMYLFIYLLTDWLTDWLIDWLTDWLIGWLINQLIGW